MRATDAMAITIPLSRQEGKTPLTRCVNWVLPINLHGTKNEPVIKITTAYNRGHTGPSKINSNYFKYSLLHYYNTKSPRLDEQLLNFGC